MSSGCDAGSARVAGVPMGNRNGVTTVTSASNGTSETNPDGPRVAVLGLGTMGAAMARRILDAGLPLTVWNRNPDRAEPFRDTGARIAPDAEDAVSDADVVLTMLFDGGALRSVMDLALPRMARGAVWMQSSTVGVSATAQFAAAAQEHQGAGIGAGGGGGTGCVFVGPVVFCGHDGNWVNRRSQCAISRMNRTHAAYHASNGRSPSASTT